MTRRMMMLATLGFFVAIGPTTAWAHDDYRIIGTVTKITAKMLDVKQTKDGKVVSIDMLDTTIVTRETKKVARTELKVGLSVVVDARGDSIDELEAVEVKIVAPPGKK